MAWEVQGCQRWQTGGNVVGCLGSQALARHPATRPCESGARDTNPRVHPMPDGPATPVQVGAAMPHSAGLPLHPGSRPHADLLPTRVGELESQGTQAHCWWAPLAVLVPGGGGGGRGVGGPVQGPTPLHF